MSLPVPLSVTLMAHASDGSGAVRASRRVTRELRDLTFKSTIPGGYASCEMSFVRPLLVQSPEVAYFSRVFIHDTRNGAVVWEGYLEDPGRGATREGEIWELTAMGPAGHAHDISFPVVYIDRRLADPWGPATGTHRAIQIDEADNDSAVASIRMFIPRGTVATLDTFEGRLVYQDIREALQTLARVRFKHVWGVTDSNWRMKLHTRKDGGALIGAIVDHQSWTTEQTIDAEVGTTNFLLDHNEALIRLQRVSGTVTVSDDNTHARIYDVTVRGRLLDVYGVEITNNEDFEDGQVNFVFDQGDSQQPWGRSTIDKQSGSWSMKSGTITHNQKSDMVVSVPPWAKKVQFWYRVDSESGFDFFRVLKDGTSALSASGNVAWTQSAQIDVSTTKFLTFRYEKDGSVSTGGDRAFVDNVTFFGDYSSLSIVASDVVRDVLGRACPLFDGVNALIETTTYGITQLQFMDGATPDEIFNELLELEPNMYWAAWEHDRSRPTSRPPSAEGPRFDASSFFLGTATGDFSWTHTVRATQPQGVLVFVVQNASTTDEVVGVTYGGVAMEQVPLSPLIHSTGSEDGVIHAFFLGNGIPAGNQVVAVDVSGGSVKDAVCWTVTSKSSTTEIENTSTLDSGGVANPSVTLTTAVPTFIAGALHSGHDNLASVTPGSGFEKLDTGQDFGAQTSHYQHRTTPAPAGSPTCNWTATSEEAGILAVAVRDGPRVVSHQKHRFEFRSWPTHVRYEATIRGRFNSPGSAEGLFNQAIVRWRNSSNFVKQTRVSQVVPELTAAGRTRQALIDLGDEKGAAENATRVGQEYLKEHLTPPNAGVLEITGPILDRDRGRMVMPWELVPGHLIRVRGVLPRQDALNPTTRDGITIFRVVSVTFNADDATAELELDVPQRTADQILAELVQAKQRRGRSLYFRRR